MTETRAEDGVAHLPPPGSRWGVGACSVLPYLARTLQARPAATAEASATHASRGTTPPRGKDGGPPG